MSNDNEALEKYKNIQKRREITKKINETPSQSKTMDKNLVFENISRYVKNLENSHNVGNSSKNIKSMQKQHDFLTLSQFKAPDDEELDYETGKSSPILPKHKPEPLEDFNIKNANFQGLTTASNKKIAVSDDALHKVQEMFDNIENETNQNCYKPFQGFSTASNKKIIISDDALQKVQGIFDEEHKTDKENFIKKSFNGFSTASNKKIAISNVSLQKVRGMFDEIENKPMAENEYSKLPMFQGFTTANNKKIEISNDALIKAKEIFDNVEEKEISENNPGKLFQGFSTASNKKIEVSTKALNKVKEMCCVIQNEEIKPEEQSFQGFKTASDKNITVSGEALNKVKKIFSDIQNNETSLDENRDIQDILKNVDDKSNNFQGFTTASNKTIQISKTALEKSKKVFENIDNAIEKDFVNDKNEDIRLSKESLNSCDREIKEEKVSFQEILKNVDKNLNNFQGFATASNKTIEISKKALEKSKNVFENIDNTKEKDFIQEFVNETDEDIQLFKESLCDEEMINAEFENEIIEYNLKNTKSVHKNDIEMEISLTQEISDSTSAFLADETNSSITNPTSPILTPKINIKRTRKKFCAPFKKDKKTKLSSDNLDTHQPAKKPKLCEETPAIIKSNLLNLTSLKLDDDCTKKAITLKNLYDQIDKLKPNKNIPDEVLNISPENSLKFIFSDKRQNLISLETSLRTTDLEDVLLKCEGVDKNLIPNGWIANHLKWIIWKLGSYERVFGETCHEILNAKNVVQQLKYRYDKELFKAQRPILRKIIETDDIPGRRMILCVSKICFPLEDSNKIPELEVTDGWYSINAKIDECLCKAVKNGKIKIGTKLLMYGAELINCQQGKSPLEDMGDTKLLIHGNSCRRVKPWTKLGLWSQKSIPPRFSLLKSHCQGGHLPIVTFLAVNVYPSLFIEKLESGDRITRSEKLELQHCSTIEVENQLKIEQIYNQVEKEFTNQETSSLREVISESDGFHLPSCMDTQDYAAMLSTTQKKDLNSLFEKKQLDLKQQIDIKVKNLMEEKGITKKRKVVEVAKIKGLIMENEELHITLLTIWGPSDEIKNMLKENKLINLYNITPTGRRYDGIHLSAGKKTILCDVPDNQKSKFTGWEKYKRQCSLIREMQSTTFSPIGNDVDTVGIVIHVEPPLDEALDTKPFSSKVQTLYLSDENHFMIAVNFWTGIKKYGYDNIIKVGCVLACANLQHRARTSRKRLRYLYATEMSTFSQNPKKEHLNEAFQYLKNCFSSMDRNDFVHKCNEKLKLANSTPKKIVEEESGLELLDFESTFVDSTKSINESFLTMNESNVEKRLKKLEMYGEPPPLIPVELNVSATLKKEFILPVSKCS